MKIDNFFAELKRRNVYKVAVAYAIVGWLLVQVATQVFPFFEIPNWAVRLIVLMIVIGFPIVIVGALLSIGLFLVGRYTAPDRVGTNGLPEKSIAVLPFENQNRDPDTD